MKNLLAVLHTKNNYNIVIANPLIWDEAICYRLLRRLKSGLLVMTKEA